MIDSYLVLTPLILLPLVALLAFVGCGFQAGYLPPRPKTPVVTAEPGDRKVTLTWPPDIYADKFSVYRGTMSGAIPPIPVKEVTGGAGWVDEPRDNGKEYFYIVTASDAFYTSPDSIEVSATPNGPVVAPTIRQFVKSKVLGNTVSAANWFGLAFTVGSEPLRVRELGRARAPGNNGTHPLRLIDAAAMADVAGVNITIGPGVDGEFQYGVLPSVITLTPNKLYYLVSQEFAGGDLFYNHTTTVQTTSAAEPEIAGTVTGSVVGNGTTHSVDLSGQVAYGPVDFKYEFP
jgi:hypothetical protein